MTKQEQANLCLSNIKDAIEILLEQRSTPETMAKLFRCIEQRAEMLHRLITKKEATVGPLTSLPFGNRRNQCPRNT